ncbi:MAG TPA: hypothetical protein VGJ43_17305 [Acidimicrobiales bacterium]
MGPGPSQPGGTTGPGRPTRSGLGGLAAGLGDSAFARRAPESDGGADPGGLTSGGLARRVRGAQMPVTSPVSVHRAGPGAADRAPAGTGGATAPPRTAQQKQSADAVYSFLTNFSAGVQRGLDETRGEKDG